MKSYDMLRRSCFLSSLALGICLLFSACQPGGEGVSEPTAKVVDHAPQDGIQWFEGTVEQAFAAAREQEKPLFAYWGAKWCPPCNQLKSTVFKQPEFVAQTRAYIALHIDGDAPDAQRWAEHFGAMGYPTLIVFNSEGVEQTRLSSGMELERYARVLDSAYSGRSLSQLVRQALAGSTDLSLQEWERLAWYPWGVDQDRLLEPKERLQLLQVLRDANMPNEQIQRRVELAWWLEREHQEKLRELSESDARNGRALLLEILSDDADWRGSLTDLQYGALPLIVAVSQAGSTERSLLMQAFEKAMEIAWSDTSLGGKDRVLTVRALIRSYRAEHGDADLPANLVRKVRQRLDVLAAEAQTPYERQTVMFYIAWYHHEIGDSEKAIALLEDELKTAVAPYYYMSYLSDIESARGNVQAALNWSGRAFASASGAATRFQWGIQHLYALMELSPDDVAAVRGVLGELHRIAKESPGSLYQRSRVRLERLNKPLQGWAEQEGARRDMLVKWREDWKPVCQSITAETDARKTCEGFLAAL